MDPEKGVETVQDAIAGSCDIIAEQVADRSDYRKSIREWTMKEGWLAVKAKDEKAESVYEMYYDFREPLSKMAGYRILAVNRGEKEKFLTVKVEAPEPQILHALCKTMIRDENGPMAAVLKEAVIDGYHRLIAPAIERDIRNELTEKAQSEAITVFGKEFKTASHAAAHQGTDSPRMGSGFPDRL